MIRSSPNLKKMLLEQQESIEKRMDANIGWEREKGKGNYFSFGKYRLSIRSSSGKKDEIFIVEDCSSISTRVWDCAVLTAKWFEKNVFSLSVPSSGLLQTLRKKVGPDYESDHHRPIQVLELGSGTGLLSICLAKMGTNIAVMSTEHRSALNHLERNVVRNYVDSSNSSDMTTTLTAGRVSCRELNWYKSKESLQSLLPNKSDSAVFDLIVVTDCSLSERDSRGVLDMIQKYGLQGHTMVVAGICNEREGTPYFIKTSKDLFADYMIIPQADFHKDYQSSRQTIMLIQV